MTISDFVVSQLCLVSWREAQRLAPGNRDAMIGIAHCIHNRIVAGWHSGDWLKVISEYPLHSADLIEDIDFRSLPELRDPNFNWLVPQVERLYSGTLRDTVTASPSIAFAMPRADALGKRAIAPPPHGALFWCDLNRVTRKWFKDNILAVRDQHPILSHSFPLTFIG
ncbi:MAG: hypothetical protein JWQ87_5446 [Candidatus Sulfotelmatobacter sp.]|nr:hypothetical protein [Candidatus Sulfotelmatobacter sp.]